MKEWDKVGSARWVGGKVDDVGPSYIDWEEVLGFLCVCVCACVRAFVCACVHVCVCVCVKCLDWMCGMCCH